MLTGRTLVLASTSTARRALLERLRVPFEVIAPSVDEDTIRGDDGEHTARLRAVAKAESVAKARPDAVVIGSDQVVELDGDIRGKPGSNEGARAQLARLAGRMHRLITSVAIVGLDRDGGIEGDRGVDGSRSAPSVGVDVHRMSMRPLVADEIGRYVAADAPAGCAGSYKVESLGIALFERIEGNDWTAIVGLPLLMVCSMLRRGGFALP
jgi:septum formation protein